MTKNLKIPNRHIDKDLVKQVENEHIQTEDILDMLKEKGVLTDSDVSKKLRKKTRK